MDFNQDNGEGLFGARNENSVLFSLDGLNELDQEPDGGDGVARASGEESGLINLNTIGRMSDSRAGAQSFGGMSFNEIETKREKRKRAAVVFCFILMICAFGAGGYMLYDYLMQQQSDLAERYEEANRTNENKLKEAEVQEDALRARIAELEQMSNERRASKDSVKAELDKMRGQAQVQAQNDASASDGAKSERKHKRSSDKADKPAGDNKGGDKAAPAVAGGKKADPAEIKAALAAANKKATKCAKDGNLNISMSLQPDGSAKDVTPVSGTFKGSASEKCIVTVFEKHQFPTFSGAAIPVKYTVKL